MAVPRAARSARSSGNGSRRGVAAQRQCAATSGISTSPPVAGVSSEQLQRQLEELRTKVAATSGVERLFLTQKKLDVEQALRRAVAERADGDRDGVERSFVAVAVEFSVRHKISWQAWREVGVPASVLRQCGLRPGNAHLR